MHAALKAIAGFAAGAAVMYLLDPNSGRRRRALVRDQGAAAARKATRYVEGRSRLVAGRAKGALAQARGRLHRDEVVDDDVLLARVRAALGHVAAHPSQIEAQVHEGTVLLRGQAPGWELADIMARVNAVPGVVEVDNRLVVPAY